MGLSDDIAWSYVQTHPCTEHALNTYGKVSRQFQLYLHLPTSSTFSLKNLLKQDTTVSYSFDIFHPFMLPATMCTENKVHMYRVMWKVRYVANQYSAPLLIMLWRHSLQRCKHGVALRYRALQTCLIPRTHTRPKWTERSMCNVISLPRKNVFCRRRAGGIFFKMLSA